MAKQQICIANMSLRGWKMDQTKWETGFQAALKNECIKKDQNNNLQFSISEVLAEGQGFHTSKKGQSNW